MVVLSWDLSRVETFCLQLPRETLWYLDQAERPYVLLEIELNSMWP